MCHRYTETYQAKRSGWLHNKPWQQTLTINIGKAIAEGFMCCKTLWTLLDLNWQTRRGLAEGMQGGAGAETKKGCVAEQQNSKSKIRLQAAG